MKQDIIELFETDESFRRTVVHHLLDDPRCLDIFVQKLSDSIYEENSEKTHATYWRKAVSLIVIAVGMFAKDILDWITKR